MPCQLCNRENTTLVAVSNHGIDFTGVCDGTCEVRIRVSPMIYKYDNPHPEGENYFVHDWIDPN